MKICGALDVVLGIHVDIRAHIPLKMPKRRCSFLIASYALSRPTETERKEATKQASKKARKKRNKKKKETQNEKKKKRNTERTTERKKQKSQGRKKDRQTERKKKKEENREAKKEMGKREGGRERELFASAPSAARPSFERSPLAEAKTPPTDSSNIRSPLWTRRRTPPHATGRLV